MKSDLLYTKSVIMKSHKGGYKYMEFILIIIFILIIFKPMSAGNSKTSNSSSKRFDNKDDGFDPADTFYLEDGLDHKKDYDGYCEECDDYHDA